MEEFLRIAASIGGISGVLAMAILLIYRQDRKDTYNQLREDRKFMEDRLTKIIEADVESRNCNTKTLSELTTLIERLNGKLRG